MHRQPWVLRLLLVTVASLFYSNAYAIAAASSVGASAPQPWLNKNLTPDQRAHLAIEAMTMDEKIQLVFGYFSTDASWKNSKRPPDGLPDSAGYIPGIRRLGIPAQFQTDAGLGVATQRTPHPRGRTALPSGLATAATWNRELAYAGGAMIGNEAHLSGFNVHLAGGINLVREPRNGRNFEYASEDPLLAGVIVGEEVRGIQSNHVISTIKHYAFNNQETNRFTVDVQIKDAAARVSDLLAFELAIEIGDPGSVMCAYNRINGFYACESDWLLNQVLKKDWGYKGYVMSDWGATHSTIPAANAGLDQESGYPFDVSPYFKDALKEAVTDGFVADSRFNDMVLRILRQMFAKGLFEDAVTGDHGDQIDYRAHAEVTQADAEEGIVLLKNEGVLPLNRNLKKIAIIGGHADVGVLSGGGSSQVYPVDGMAVPNEGPNDFPGPMVYYPSSPKKALSRRVQGDVVYNNGKDKSAAAKLAAGSDVAIVFATQWTGESIDAPSLHLPNEQDALIAEVAKANKNVVVVLENGGPVVMPWLSDVKAVIEAWYPGTRGGEALAKILTGETNPSGHLPVTFPASESQLPHPTIDGDPTKEGVKFTADYNNEGAAVGYKWFDRKNLKPLYPFGYGLSYTNFSYTGLKASGKNGPVTVTVDIKNNGGVEGKAVAQIYVNAPHASHWEAPQRLAGWAKVHLKPGQSTQATIKIDPRLLATFNAVSKKWEIAAGDYKVRVGDSATSVSGSVHLHLAAKSFSARHSQ